MLWWPGVCSQSKQYKYSVFAVVVLVVLLHVVNVTQNETGPASLETTQGKRLWDNIFYPEEHLFLC